MGEKKIQNKMIEDKKKEIDEKIEALRKAKCSYPDCKTKQFMTVMLPIGKITETGKIVYPQDTKEQSIQTGVPLCWYHFCLAEKGIIQVVEENNQMKLIVPTELIYLIESIIEAKEWEKQMEKGIKEK